MRVHLGSDHAGLELKDHLTRLARRRTATSRSTTARSSTTPSTTTRCSACAPPRPSRPSGPAGSTASASSSAARATASRWPPTRSPGIRCALAWSEETAALAREHNDANVVVGRRPDALARGHDPLRRGLPDHAVQRRRAARPADRPAGGVRSRPASCRRCPSPRRGEVPSPTMPEGHTLHRLADRSDATRSRGRRVRVRSPQGRFADAAALLDGQVLVGAEALGQAPVRRVPRRPLRARPPRPVRQVRRGHAGRRRRCPCRSDRCGCGWSRTAAPGRRTPTCAAPRSASWSTAAERDAVVGRLGPDPLRPDADPERAWARIRRSTAPIGDAADGPGGARRGRQRLPRRGAVPAPHPPAAARPHPPRPASGGRCGTTSSS